jgi:hypothetical protein
VIFVIWGAILSITPAGTRKEDFPACFKEERNLSYRIFTLNDPYEKHDNGDYEKNVDEPSNGIHTNNSKHPKCKKDKSNDK